MRKRLSITLFVLLVLAVLIFLNNSFSLFSFFQSITQSFLSTPKRLIYSVSKTFPGTKKNEMNTLKEENKKLIEKMVNYEKLQKENIALSSQFKESNENSQKLLPASVVGFSGKETTPYVITIDKGSRHSVKKNMTVVVGQHLVGYVDKVSPSFSEVILPVSKKFSVLGVLQEKGSEGIVKGEEDFVLFDHVLTTEDLKKGDVLLTKGNLSADGTGIIPNLIIGKATTVNRVETNPFQSAEIVSMINYSKLTMVFVVVEQ